MIPAFPLAWPAGWPRAAKRKSAPFKKHERVPTDAGSALVRRDLTVFDGVERVLTELAHLSVDRQDVVVSTNVRTRLDGLPRSGEPKPDDPGVAVYWQAGEGAPRVMAVDLYDEVADNLAAIALTLSAMRAIERHGGARILERVFTGFTALPGPGQTTARGWRDVLGFPTHATVTRSMIDARYRSMRSEAHPDRGGSADEFHVVQQAYEQAVQELRA